MQRVRAALDHASPVDEVAQILLHISTSFSHVLPSFTLGRSPAETGLHLPLTVRIFSEVQRSCHVPSFALFRIA